MTLHGVPCDVVNEFLALWEMPDSRLTLPQDRRIHYLITQYPELLEDCFQRRRWNAIQRGRDRLKMEES